MGKFWFEMKINWDASSLTKSNLSCVWVHIYKLKGKKWSTFNAENVDSSG